MEKRQRKQYTSPLRVTAIPTGMPARILKPAIAFFARVMHGLCPVTVEMSLIAFSRTFAF